jgi:hypothetical protein
MYICIVLTCTIFYGKVISISYQNAMKERVESQRVFQRVPHGWKGTNELDLKMAPERRTDAKQRLRRKLPVIMQKRGLTQSDELKWYHGLSRLLVIEDGIFD